MLFGALFPFLSMTQPPLTGRPLVALIRSTRLILVALTLVACQLRSAAESKPPMMIFLLCGQSNMAGRDTTALADQTTDPRILTLDAKNQWGVARDPIHAQTGRILPGVGPGIAFAQAVLAEHPDYTIGLVPCAVGGSPLSRWEKDGDLHAAALARAREAQASGILAGLLWHQGESDSTKLALAATYAARLQQMASDFRAELNTPDLPIVVGQLGPFLIPADYPYAATVRAALADLPHNLPHCGLADSTGLHDKGDQLHFDAASARKLGARFAAAWLALTAKPSSSPPQVSAP